MRNGKAALTALQVQLKAQVSESLSLRHNETNKLQARSDGNPHFALSTVPPIVLMSNVWQGCRAVRCA
jgi:hypothetical protein